MKSSSSSHSAVGDFIRGVMAVAKLTMLESHRQRLWWFVLIAMAGLLLIIPSLEAVSSESQLKLAVSAITGTIGFITTLVAVFVVIIAVRRDLETRCSFMLFSKPLPRSAYCVGRWLGTMITLGLAIILLSCAGAGAIRLQLGALPVPQHTLGPSAWQQLNHLGSTIDVRDDQERVTMAQPSGSGFVLQFRDLDPQNPRQFLLLKGMVRDFSGFTPFTWAPLQVTAQLPGGGISPPFDLSTDSPMGRVGAEDAALPDGQFALRHRAAERRDLNSDYVRLAIPQTAIAADGSLTLNVLRVESEAGIIFPRHSGIMVSTQGEPFIVDLLTAGLVNLAQAGVLASAALAFVIVSGVGTSLLGCLTLFFGGHAIAFVGDIAGSARTSELAKRLMDLIIPVVPDFGRFEVAANLAGLRSVSFGTIIDSWLYFGTWIVVFMAFAWTCLWRREL